MWDFVNDCSPLGFSAHGTVDISYSRGSSWPRDQGHCLALPPITHPGFAHFIPAFGHSLLLIWETLQKLPKQGNFYLSCCSLPSQGPLDPPRLPQEKDTMVLWKSFVLSLILAHICNLLPTPPPTFFFLQTVHSINRGMENSMFPLVSDKRSCK